MRLSCAKCGAIYDIPKQAIPSAGGDVECTNCGHIWFFVPPNPQKPEGADPEIEEALRQVLQVKDASADATDQSSPRRNPLDEPSGLTPEVAQILRQEAEYEAAARSTKPDQDAKPTLDAAETPETENTSPHQPDESLDADQDPAPEDTEGEAEPTDDTDATIDVSEPDQEDATYPEPDPVPEKSPRRGVKWWGIAALFVLLALVGLYVFEEAVVRTIPETESAVESYVAWVDRLIASVAAWIGETNGLAPEPEAPAE